MAHKWAATLHWRKILHIIFRYFPNLSSISKIGALTWIHIGFQKVVSVSTSHNTHENYQVQQDTKRRQWLRSLLVLKACKLAHEALSKKQRVVNKGRELVGLRQDITSLYMVDGRLQYRPHFKPRRVFKICETTTHTSWRSLWFSSSLGWILLLCTRAPTEGSSQWRCCSWSTLAGPSLETLLTA